MDPLQFKDPIVNERFISLVEKDRQVEQAGTYKGKFSAITLAMASMMVRKGSNIIAFKEGFSDDDANGEKAAPTKILFGKPRPVEKTAAAPEEIK